MTILSIILGVLLIITGFSCMATPLVTFLSTGYFFAILLLVYGFSGIVRFFQKLAGGLELAVSILAVVLGVVSLARPGQTLIFDGMVLYLIAAWLLVEGISTVVMSIQCRDIRKGWGWGVVAGILGIIAGIYSFAHPMLTAVTAGILIGFYFVQAGFNMIVVSAALSAAQDEMK